MQTTHFELVGLFLFIPLLLFVLATFAFWVWMLVHCLQNQGLDGNEKLIWVLVIIFTHFLGALIYFFVGRTKGKPANL